MAHAAAIKLVASGNDVVPALFKALFPAWFAGFAFSAIAIGALVPAAVMSIGAANLFTRNVWKAYVNPDIDSRRGGGGQDRVAGRQGRCARFHLYSCRRNMRSTCNCSAACGSCRPFRRWCSACSRAGSAPKACCSAGLSASAGDRGPAWSNGLKPLATIDLGGASYVFYVGLGALILNIVVAAVVTMIVELVRPTRQARRFDNRCSSKRSPDGAKRNP